MLYRMTLQAGQYNSVNGKGRYFYLLTAADQVRVKFLDRATSTVDLTTDLREGMAAEFPLTIDEFQIVSDTAQYVEFWLSNTRLDYSKLAAGGASSTIDSGRAACGLGSSLAIPADFRRKSINLQALTDVTVGGIGVDAGTGYAMKAGETLKLGSRGDIYTYIAPAKISGVSSVVELINVPAASNDENGFQHVDALNNFFFDSNTKNLVTGYSKMVFSTDNGVTWQDSAMQAGLVGDPSDMFYELGQTENGIFVIKQYYGRIGVSRDGGASFSYFAGIEGAVNADNGETITNIFVTSAWISADEKNIIISADNAVVWESFDGGQSWKPYEHSEALAVSLECIEKSPDGIIYGIRSGILYAMKDGILTQKGGSYYGNGFSSIAVSGSKIYWFCSGNQLLQYSPDGGDTIGPVIGNWGAAGFIKKFGVSLIVGGIDTVSFIKDFGGDVVEVSAGTASGKDYGGRMVVTDDSIVVKQSLNNEDINPKATAYPATILDGARYPAPLQWLAELN